jgi:hypothetical protein
MRLGRKAWEAIGCIWTLSSQRSRPGCGTISPPPAKDGAKMRPKRSRRKKFARQTERMSVKFNYRHCPISMPVVVILFGLFFTDTGKMGSRFHGLWPNGP